MNQERPDLRGSDENQAGPSAEKVKSRSSQQALGTKQAGRRLQSNNFMQTSGLGKSDVRPVEAFLKPAMFRISHIERQLSDVLEVCQMVGAKAVAQSVLCGHSDDWLFGTVLG
jgi:hypothetical protein